MQNKQFTTSDRIQFPVRSPRDTQLDMTSMVDVTFLLLVFFMVTASFVTHQVMMTNSTQPEGPGTREFKDTPTLVNVIVDQHNQLQLVSDSTIDISSARELRTELRALAASDPEIKLNIKADTNSRHQKVMEVWDTALAAGIDRHNIKSTETKND